MDWIPPPSKPDVQVSGIRLSQRLSPHACTGHAPAKSQRSQAHALHLGKDGHAYGRPEGPLAATPQMVPKAPVRVAVDPAESALRVALLQGYKFTGARQEICIKLNDAVAKTEQTGFYSVC
jgi:hypothetical protein